MRRLLALVSAIIFVDALLFTALTPLVPAYAEEFDLSKTGAGLLVGAYGAGALLGGIPGGIGAGGYGPKRARRLQGSCFLGISSFGFALGGHRARARIGTVRPGRRQHRNRAGALAWISVAASAQSDAVRSNGTTFGVAIFGAILGPVFGGLAKLV